MKIEQYPEIKPGKKRIKSTYISVFLWITGRAIQAAYRTDKDIKKEFDSLPDDYLVNLHIAPNGPNMLVGKDKKGKAKYMGWNTKGKKVTLDMSIKNIEAGILIFTFQEGTALGFAHDRFIVTGDLVDAAKTARILDLVEFYLLPKIITKLAVKRYPKWSQISPIRKYIGRVLIYTRLILGF